MADLLYGVATKAWHPVLGCDNTKPCWERCWAKRTVWRLSQSANERIATAHRGLVCPSHDGERLLWNGTVRLNEAHLTDPLRWRKSAVIAGGYHGDLFLLPDEDLDRIFAVMALCPQHTFLMLTKRPERMREYLTYHFRVVSPGPRERVFGIVQKMPGYDPEHPKWTRLAAHAFDVVPLPNVWLGVSVTNQADADERRKFMRQLAATGWNTWVSYEPALGPVDWAGWEFVKQILSGGESGRDSRPSHPAWHRTTRDFCASHGIAYTFKQWGEWAPKANFRNFAEWDTAAAHAFVLPNGTFSVVEGRDEPDEEFGLTCADLDGNDYGAAMARVGKKAAGHLLDNQEYRELAWKGAAR